MASAFDRGNQAFVINDIHRTARGGLHIPAGKGEEGLVEIDNPRGNQKTSGNQKTGNQKTSGLDS